MKRRVWIETSCRKLAGGTDHEDEMAWLKQKKFLKVMSEDALLALRAVHGARQKLEGDWKGGGEDCGVAVGLESVRSGMADWRKACGGAREKTGQENPLPAEIGSCLPPLALLPRLPNTLAGHVAREFEATGPCWTSGGEYPGGMGAILQGARWILDGECRRVIAVRVAKDFAMAHLLNSEKPKGECREIVSWSADTSAAEEVPSVETPGPGEDPVGVFFEDGGTLEIGSRNARLRMVVE